MQVEISGDMYTKLIHIHYSYVSYGSYARNASMADKKAHGSTCQHGSLKPNIQTYSKVGCIWSHLCRVSVACDIVSQTTN